MNKISLYITVLSTSLLFSGCGVAELATVASIGSSLLSIKKYVGADEQEANEKPATAVQAKTARNVQQAQQQPQKRKVMIAKKQPAQQGEQYQTLLTDSAGKGYLYQAERGYGSLEPLLY